ncbi:unnamed protein product [Thelazia callipaeda]|uniref:Chondroitin proteoglycan 4 domain-containing protein n=1 Tax=Thelazia callipaeda TaxID=103827 RepID=A0A0N5CTA0_THECL|nr:unnamed protein product [Thelazia callipaeda]
MTSSVSLLITLLLCLEICYAQRLVRQCSCTELETCLANVDKFLVQCSEQCEKRTPGVNHELIRSCMFSKKYILDGTIVCAKNSFPNLCSKGAPKMLPSRAFLTGLELAMVNDLRKKIDGSGFGSELNNLIARGRKNVKCVYNCVTKKAGCHRNCTLDLPSDNAILQTFKTCAKSSGLQSSTVQELCYCIERAGVR